MKAMEILEKYCERIEKELDDEYKKIEKLNPLPPGELEIVDKLRTFDNIFFILFCSLLILADLFLHGVIIRKCLRQSDIRIV